MLRRTTAHGGADHALDRVKQSAQQLATTRARIARGRLLLITDGLHRTEGPLTVVDGEMVLDAEQMPAEAPRVPPSSQLGWRLRALPKVHPVRQPSASEPDPTRSVAPAVEDAAEREAQCTCR